MPITNHNLEQTVQANGGTSNIVRLYDQDGNEYLQSFYAPPDFDVAARIASMIAELDEQLATNEFNTILGL